MKLVLTSAILLTIIPFAHAAPSATPEFVQETAQLLYPDDKPAIDATAIIDVIDVKTHKVTSYTAKPDLLGNATITLPYDQYLKAQVPYAASPTGIGFSSLRKLGEIMPTILVPYTSLRIHLVDSTGKPVAHAKIGPRKLRTDYCSCGWRDTMPGPWNQTTDNNGNATLAGLPQGYDLTLVVNDDRYAILDTRHPIQLANSAVTPDITIRLSPAASLSGRVLYDQTGKPVVGIDIYVSAPGDNRVLPDAITDANGAFTVNRLPARSYNVLPFDWSKDGYTDWVGQSKNVNATAGHTTRIVLYLVQGGTITGKVSDKATGKPISNIAVSASQDQTGPAQSKQTKTSADGTYSFHMLPGSVYISATIPGVPYESAATKKLVVADKETTAADLQLDESSFPKALSGLVLGPDGKPVAGADVSVVQAYSVNSTVKTDSLGQFTLGSPGVLPKDTVFARCGDLSTPSPVVFNGEAQLTLRLTASDFCTLTGKVEDQNGNPVPNAAVMVRSESQCWLPTETVKTDANGTYIVQHAYANAKYGAYATHPGYWFGSPDTGSSDTVTAAPGQTAQFPTIVIRAANSFVGGTVLDPAGKPAANVLVSCEDRLSNYAYTDDSGRFTLRRVPDGATYLLLQPIDYNFHIHSQAVSGRTDNIIHLPPK